MKTFVKFLAFVFTVVVILPAVLWFISMVWIATLNSETNIVPGAVVLTAATLILGGLLVYMLFRIVR